MIIETQRLKIIPLTEEQFALLLEGIDRMEESLYLAPSGKLTDSHLQWVMKYQYQKAMSDKDNWLWYTNRQIVLKSENKVVGSINFKNAPDENGEVEIGYGTNAGFRNKGYMTEAVKALSEWALQQPLVKRVIAETLKDNIASHRVLEKSGMIKYRETDMAYWWKLEQ